MSEPTAYEQHEIASGSAMLLTDALAQIKAALPFVIECVTYPARCEDVNGQAVFLSASVKFVFDNERGVRLSFGDKLPTIIRLSSVNSVRETMEREYAAHNTGDRPHRFPPA